MVIYTFTSKIVTFTNLFIYLFIICVTSWHRVRLESLYMTNIYICFYFYKFANSTIMVMLSCIIIIRNSVEFIIINLRHMCQPSLNPSMYKIDYKLVGCNKV